jgi:beta-lactamase family protein
VARTSVHGKVLRYALKLRPGSYDLRVDFVSAGGRVLGRAFARDVWLLPRSAGRAALPRPPDTVLSARLAALSRALPGYAAVWIHDLRRGRTAEWNAGARFPAASMVKLAVMIAALRRFGPRPERSRIAYDLQALTGWSSNLASNRLLVELGSSERGGTAIAQRVLRSVGAASSTFTGDYRIGTSLQREPPLISPRVTTARDLGRILLALHRAALGKPAGTGLTTHEARVGLALLLSCEASGDNLGLFRRALGPRFPLAQKNGWFSAVRHTGAILYAPDGPRIAVVLTYRPGITPSEAAELGGQVVRLALSA